MRKNILLFGLASGLIITAFMIYSSAACYSNENFKSNQVVGYAGMLLAFSFIFIGIKNFRDRSNGGIISFGKAFKIGLFISLVASSLYVAVWLMDYYLFIPDFMDKYSAHVIKELRESGASQLELESKAKEVAEFKELYKNPLLVILFSYAEVLPLALLISLFSAFILKRKQKAPSL